MRLFKFRKSDSDRIEQLKIKANVNGLSKMFKSSKKLEVRSEVVKALAEIGSVDKIGSVDALAALHGFSRNPTDFLHDEIMKQLSQAMDSFVLSHTVCSVFNAKANKKPDNEETYVHTFDFWTKFNF